MTDRYTSARSRARRLLILSVSIVPASVLMCINQSSRADEWNVGVGGDSNRDGLSYEVGPVDPEILWDGSRAGIVAQQAVIGDGLVVVNRIESFTIPTGTWIVAHELETGVERWAVQLPAEFPDSWRSRVTGVRDGNVYATRSGNTNAEYLYALDSVTGDIRWRSEDLITETTTESVAFTENGDIITSGVGTLIRIDHFDGSTVWEADRSCPTSGGCDAAVYGDRAYIWEAGVDGPVITAFDVESGTRLYSTPGIGGGFIQQVAPFVGPAGTVYAPRTQNNPLTDFFVAFEDTGVELMERWRIPMGFVPFASHAVGLDGTVYTYQTERTPEGALVTIFRLDPATGVAINVSEPIVADYPVQPRIAIDADGKLFFTNGGFANGALHSFNADLTERWSTPITNVNVGGPAIGRQGVLVVCGVGTDVRAYRTAPVLRLFGPTPGIAGQFNELLATGGTVGGRIYFVYGFAEGQAAVPGCPGLQVAIASPRIAGYMGSGSNGDSRFGAFVPGAASGRRIIFQAVEQLTCRVSPPVVYQFP